MAILIGSRAHLIEFPSILLPDGVGIGSIVSIDVHRNINEEEQQKAAFWKLQNDIYMMYGIQTPVAPLLKLRHVTQTSVTLEWAPLVLATATLRSLDIYRSGSRLATIPNPSTTTSSKLSSLQISTKYTFQLVLRTTAGTYPSNVVEVKTRAIEDTSGISVCFGTILDADVDGDSSVGGGGGGGAKRKEELKAALEEMGAKWSDKIQIDTTHFVCTTSLSLTAVGMEAGVHSGLATASASASALKTTGEEPGVEYQKAMQLSIPIVQPDWVLACYYGKKMVPTAPYYLGTSIPPLVQGHNRVQSISQRQLSQPHPPLPPATPTTTTTTTSSSTTPPPRRTSSTAPQPFIASTPGATKSLPKNPSPHITPTGTPFFTGGDAPNSADPTITALPTPGTSIQSNAPNTSSAGDGEDDLDEGDESPTTPSGKSPTSPSGKTSAATTAATAAAAAAARKRTGTMNKAFKFPPGADGKRSPGLTISPPPPMPIGPPIIVVHEAKESVDARLREAMEGGHETAERSGGGGRKEAERGRDVEPPTPDLDSSSSGMGVGGIGREEAEEGGEIVDIDLS